MIRFSMLMREVTRDIDLITSRDNAMNEYEAMKYGSPEPECCFTQAIEPFFISAHHAEISTDNVFQQGRKIL